MDKTLERAMMGWFLRGENLEDIRKFEVSDFQDEACRRIFEQMKNKPKIGMIELAEVTGIHIGELAEMTQSDRTSQRLYSEGFNEIMRQKRNNYLLNNPNLTAEEIIEIAKKYGEKTPQTLPKPDENMAVEHLKVLDRRQNEKIIDTGFKRLDSILFGLRKGEMTVISGRPGDGKSALAMDIAENVRKQGKKVLFFRLEMSAEQIMDRRLLKLTGLTTEKLRRGNLSRSEWDEVNVALDKLHAEEKSGNLLFFDVNKLALVREMVNIHKPYLIVIDQLEQLASDLKFKDKRERFSYMTSNLKRLALDKNVAVILLAQLNREATGRKPTLANLKESGSIEEDSDNVILLHSVDSDCVDFSGNFNGTMVHTNLAKHRNGETGEFFLGFNKNRCRFENIS